MSEPAYPPPPLFALGTSIYAQRAGQILILKRAMGALTGSWYLPGGALDRGEGLEDCAVRELHEETGLTPSGPLALIGLLPMHLYGHDMYIVAYACDSEEGDVVLSEEHSAARWIEPERYRADFFSEEQVKRVEEANAQVGGVARAIQRDLDSYLVWRSR